VLDSALGVAEKSGQQSRLAWILARLGKRPDRKPDRRCRGGHAATRTAAGPGLGDSALAAGIQNDLGNALAARKKMDDAVAAYRDSAALAERVVDPPSSSGRG
jgi:hypothetical protein